MLSRNINEIKRNILMTASPLTTLKQMPLTALKQTPLTALKQTPLTRHFYSTDEVHAALQYASHRVEYQETLFWCKELLCSGYVSETISTLFESWLWHRGPFHLQWLVEAWNNLAGDEITEDAILLSAYQLSSCTQRDHSLWNILVVTLEDNGIPDHVTPRSPSSFPSDDSKEMYFIRAIYQGKSRCAWWISRHFTEERLWWLLEWYITHIVSITKTHITSDQYSLCFKALEQYEQLLGYRSAEYDVIVRCLAIISLCTPVNTKPLPSVIDSRYISSLHEWDQCEGHIERRIYSIPSACLYGITYRGSILWSQQTKGLHNVEREIIGCPFWEEALSEYGTIDIRGTIQWKSHDATESFYNKYFPDDIPDEWTKKEKQKSHGDGVLGPDEKITLLKYAKLHLSKGCRLAWYTTDLTHLILNKNIKNSTDCNPSAIVKLFKPPADILDSDLVPRRKRFLL